MEDHEIQVVYGERGGEQLTFNGYKFNPYRTSKKTDERSWRCCNRKCKAKLYTMGDLEPTFSRLEGPHDHPAPDKQATIRKAVWNNIKRKATDDLCEKPAKYIHRELEENQEFVDILTKRDIKLISNNVSKARLKTIPPEKVHAALSVMNVKMITEDDFMVVNEEEQRNVILSCTSNLEALCQTKTLLIDGTFEHAAKFSTQLFTIHGYSDNVYTPLVSCLLKDKQKDTYAMTLQLLRDRCEAIGVVLRPETIVVDTEEAVHEGIRATFPDASIASCSFHLGQACVQEVADETPSQDISESDTSNNEESFSVQTTSKVILPAKDNGSCKKKVTSNDALLKSLERKKQRDHLMKTVATAFSPQMDKDDDVDHFFKSMAMTVKSFSPAERAEAKFKVMEVVSGIEMRRFSSTDSQD